MTFITKEQLDKAIPLARDGDIERYYAPLVAAMDEYEINKPRRIAAFLGNLAHESGSLRLVEENLNYSATRLQQVFPRYFRGRNVWAYNHHPEKIANVVYAARMGMVVKEQATAGNSADVASFNLQVKIITKNLEKL